MGEVILPEEVTEIGDYAFFGCTSLSNVVFQGEIKQVGENAFLGCDNLKLPDALRLPKKLFVSIRASAGNHVTYFRIGFNHRSILYNCAVLK